MSNMKEKKKMNITPQEIIDFGKVILIWGGILMLLGSALIIFGYAYKDFICEVVNGIIERI